MCAIDRAVIIRMPMCASRVLLEVVSTKGMYGMVVPMNTPLLQPRDVSELITYIGRVFL